jgi:hypothetical protein
VYGIDINKTLGIPQVTKTTSTEKVQLLRSTPAAEIRCDIGFRRAKILFGAYSNDAVVIRSSAILVWPTGKKLADIQKRSYVHSAFEIIASPTALIRPASYAIGELPSSLREYREANVNGKPANGVIHAIGEALIHKAELKAAGNKLNLFFTHHRPTDSVKDEYRRFCGTYSVRDAEGEVLEITVVAPVIVVAEGVSAYYHYLDSEAMKLNERWAIVDFGGKTLTVAIVSGGTEEEDLRYQFEAGGSILLGQEIMNHPKFQNAFASHQCVESGRSIQEILDGIERGDYTFFDRFSYREAFDYAVGEWRRTVGSQIQQQFSQEFSSLKGFYFIGGSSVFYQELAERATSGGVITIVPDGAATHNLLGLLSTRVKENHG